MTDTPHETLVDQQFGPRAAAYVTSAVHAGGEDLQRLAEIVRGRQDARVLDLGCGGGHVGFTVAPHVREVVACDLAPRMLAAVEHEARRRGLGNLTTRRGAVDRLPFAEGAFDFVFCRYSAHHWHDFHGGLGQARRILRDDGRAVFMDVVSPGQALLDTCLQAMEILRDPSHVRDYSCEEWARALAGAGFTVVDTTTRRLRLEFTPWVERMRTPVAHVQAIRSLQTRMAEEVVAHFGIEADGTFTVDTASLEAVPA